MMCVLCVCMCRNILWDGRIGYSISFGRLCCGGILCIQFHNNLYNINWYILVYMIFYCVPHIHKWLDWLWIFMWRYFMRRANEWKWLVCLWKASLSIFYWVCYFVFGVDSRSFNSVFFSMTAAGDDGHWASLRFFFFLNSIDRRLTIKFLNIKLNWCRYMNLNTM